MTENKYLHEDSKLKWMNHKCKNFVGGGKKPALIGGIRAYLLAKLFVLTCMEVI